MAMIDKLYQDALKLAQMEPESSSYHGQNSNSNRYKPQQVSARSIGSARSQ